jgi:AraC-like DNA-binding protein
VTNSTDFTSRDRKFAVNAPHSPQAGAFHASLNRRGDDDASDTVIDSFPRVRMSTADLPERDRVALWREHFAHTIFSAEVEPACDASFRALVISRALPDLHLRYGALSPVRITRRREFLADGNDDFALVINRAGRIVAGSRGREVVLDAGDAVLVNCSETIAFDRHTRGGSFSMRIPHGVLAPLVSGIDDVVMRPIRRTTDALLLLARYTAPLLDDDALTVPELRRLAVTHVHDLVALALGATREAADAARARGVRAAHLSRAKAYIVEKCNDPSLSVGTVAGLLGVTPRYLQKLFERDGGTFSAFLLGQRLTCAHRALTQPEFDAPRVSAIAYEVGFGDLSYFNRRFRQRYGATPRDIREAHRPRNGSRPAPRR